MSVSTDGQICFGILLGEYVEFPWSEHGDDPEKWWREAVLGWNPTEDIFDEHGNWKNGRPPPPEVRNQYYDEKHAFDDSHPKLPVSAVNGCHYENPVWILALNSKKFLSARRGHPEAFEPSDLVATAEDAQELLDFCAKYGIEVSQGNAPRWYLSSYWG